MRLKWYMRRDSLLTDRWKWRKTEYLWEVRRKLPWVMWGLKLTLWTRAAQWGTVDIQEKKALLELLETRVGPMSHSGTHCIALLRGKAVSESRLNELWYWFTGFQNWLTLKTLLANSIIIHASKSMKIESEQLMDHDDAPALEWFLEEISQIWFPVHA